MILTIVSKGPDCRSHGISWSQQHFLDAFQPRSCVNLAVKKEDALSILSREPKTKEAPWTGESGGVNAMKRVPSSVRMKEEVPT
jgi:hypothetical protein